jgi:hypothetical protein
MYGAMTQKSNIKKFVSYVVVISGNSSVGIANGVGVDGRVSIPSTDFSLHHDVRMGSGLGGEVQVHLAPYLAR